MSSGLRHHTDFPSEPESRPVEKGRGGACFRKHGDRTEAIGEVGITRQVVSRCGPLGGTSSRYVSDLHAAATSQQLIEDVIPRVIDIGIDLVCGQVPGFQCEPHTDVPADLADPDWLALET